MPPSEATVRYPFWAAAGRWQLPRGAPPPTNPLSEASWWNWGHPPVSPACSELEPATSKCCTIPWASPPPMAKYPATVMPIDPLASAVTSGAFWKPRPLRRGDPAAARPVVDVRHLDTGLAVQDLDPEGRGHDHVLVAVSRQVRRGHRPDDGAEPRGPSRWWRP